MAITSFRGTTETVLPVSFFDRDVGTALPKALDILRLPTNVEYHQNHFPTDAQDDVWMADVGPRGWIVVGHDSQHHRRPIELSAIQQYGIGCFYLWGRHAVRWEKMRCFPNAYQRIFEAIDTTPKHFVYRITQVSRLEIVSI